MQLANQPLPPNFKFALPMHMSDVTTCETLRDKAIKERRQKGVPALTPTWHSQEQEPTISIPMYNDQWRDELEGCGWNDSDGDVYGTALSSTRIPLYSSKAQEFLKNESGSNRVHDIRPGVDIRELYADKQRPKPKSGLWSRRQRSSINPLVRQGRQEH